MLVKSWKKLPKEFQTEQVRPYYEILRRKWFSLLLKRIFDIVVSLVMLIILSPFFLILAIAIKIDSPGPVFYRQERVTQYGKKFRIFKFRSMVSNADKIGSAVTVNNDSRVTRVGKFIRKCRLDEVSQLIDVLRGTMTFVGTRPEVTKYVDRYTPEMLATLLLPAGITSNASIYYKDEAKLLDASADPDETYVNEVLPAKMYYNLKSIKNFGFFRDIGVMFKTVFAVLGKDYKGDYDPSVVEVEEVEEVAVDKQEKDNE
ncbi:MAG: sugar transferase [Clostridia bacterium]|nr:sugar transferase [Clostridia bacterium]